MAAPHTPSTKFERQLELPTTSNHQYKLTSTHIGCCRAGAPPHAVHQVARLQSHQRLAAGLQQWPSLEKINH